MTPLHHPPSSPRWPAILALVLSLVLVGTIALRLLSVRFAAGDMYPPYSSLRSDPLGARVLHDALADTPGLRVARSLGVELPADAAPGVTLLILGLPPADSSIVPTTLVQQWETLARGGGRVVVAFLPRVEDRRDRVPPPTSSLAPEDNPVASLRDRWEFVVSRFEPRDPAASPLPTEAQRNADAAVNHPFLPPAMPWYSLVHFGDTSSPWHTLYTQDGQPVAIERRWGAGHLVVTTDAYALSNEALRRQRQSDWIAWLLGNASQVVFEERHLGIQAVPGVAGLARRYQLHGLAAGLCLLAALWVWRSLATLVPRHHPTTPPAPVAGHGSEQALAPLLRRVVRPHDLPQVWVDTWSQSVGRDPSWRPTTTELQTHLQTHTPPSSQRPSPFHTLSTLHSLVHTRSRSGPRPPLALPKPKLQ
jgi:hypothetical protein